MITSFCKHAAVLALAATAWLGSAGAADTTSALEKGFAQPPDTARPWVYWFVMDGNFTREGITADFEAMKRAGIGGVIFMEVNAGIPQGPVKFMSPEWRQLIKHAVAEAERLGLQITLNAGPGWTGSGGPWVKPDQSMQHVVASALEVTGPTNFSAALPRPSPRPAYFGNAGLPQEMLKAKDAFGVEVAVLAVPRTSDATRISDIDEKALYLRHPYSSRPGTKAFLPSPANYPALPANALIPADRVVDLTGKLDAQGRLTWSVPDGQWTILRFMRTSTGANTRPAPAPGLGLECDKFDPVALDAHFDAFIGALLRDIGPRKESPDVGWNMLHIDSWEMGAQNWTAAFRDEFRRRRGYDSLRYLPAVTGRVVESLEVSERFLWDLRQTAQELTIENHAQHLKELGHQHGFGLSIEPYDMNPCSDMSLGAVADVPMCEFWLYGFNSTFSVIESTSIGHTCGRPIIAAESFTSSDAERWQAHPASMKTLGDWAFSSGVNRIVFHRYQHQPRLDRWPGMTMGPYGVHWERTQTWWDLVPAYHAYLARCQYLLRQGLPVADVCFLVAEGAPHVFRPPKSATRGHPPERLGYNFDGIAPDTFLARMNVQDGKLLLPDGMSYRVLVLPERDTMTPTLLRKVKELVTAGATVIGPRPRKSPSLSGFPKCDQEVQALAEELWGKAGRSDGVVEKGSDGKNAALQHSTTPLLQRSLGLGRVLWVPAPPSVLADETADPLAHAKWIWFKEGNPAANAPVAKRFFRRVVTLDPDAKVETAQVFITADNTFDLFVNGQHVGTGDSFHETYALDVAALLRAGPNILAVEGENGGDAPNPAGLIAALVVKFRDGRVLEVPTDRTWQSRPAAEGNWTTGTVTAVAGWSAALELGPLGMSPWNKGTRKTATEPEQYGDFSLVTGVLNQMGAAPDFESDGPLRYAHRRTADADIYFVANREERAVEPHCTFRVAGPAPKLWDPLTGETRALPEFTTHDGRTTVLLLFEAAQSFFILFPKSVAKNAQSTPNMTTLEPATPSRGLRHGIYGLKIPLPGPWEVSFDPKWGGPEKITFQKLEDWSKRAEDGIKFYSGLATYRKNFDLPPGTIILIPGTSIPRRLFLDLGTVKNLARVRLNGHELGVVWCAPWRVDITSAVQPKDNALEITVANLWPNRLIGDQSLPSEKRFTSTTWNPYKKDSHLLESGLLGPVTFQTTSREPGPSPR